MRTDMRYVTPASAIEAVLKLRGFTVIAKGKQLSVSLPRTRSVDLHPGSNIVSFGKHNFRTLKGTTPNEVADELADLLKFA